MQTPDFNMTDFKCIPPCKSCREAQECARFQPKADMQLSIAEAQDIVTRKRTSGANLYPQELISLPCGCLGVPWPLVHVMGTNFDELFCERHGWQKLTREKRKKMTKEARNLYHAYVAEQNRQGNLLSDEPPY